VWRLGAVSTCLGRTAAWLTGDTSEKLLTPPLLRFEPPHVDGAISREMDGRRKRGYQTNTAEHPGRGRRNNLETSRINHIVRSGMTDRKKEEGILSVRVSDHLDGVGRIYEQLLNL